MPKTSLKEAEDVKTKILKEADACEVGPVQISLAIGIATKTLKHQNIQEVVNVSDNNMYREKLKYGKTERDADKDEGIRMKECFGQNANCQKAAEND